MLEESVHSWGLREGEISLAALEPLPFGMSTERVHALDADARTGLDSCYLGFLRLLCRVAAVCHRLPYITLVWPTYSTSGHDPASRMAHAAYDFYSYNGLAPLSHQTNGHTVYPSRKTYPERFRYLYNKAKLRIQKLQQIALDTVEKGNPGGRQERARDKVLQYAARRPAQADMWLQEAQTNYNKHSAWLDKHGSHELDMKLENLDQALDNMLLEGNFSWVCIDILYSACLSGTCEETDHVFVCKAMHV